ncbi:hypothetical protein FACS1894219_11420 [Clostridia bacterium]|nr:hypothetical protein FACS1894219_11420 [Clostridia bacterium]
MTDHTPDILSAGIEKAIHAYSASETLIRRKEEALRRLDVEYNKEFQRISLIDGKARTMGVTLLSILTLFINFFPLSGILARFESESTDAVILAEIVILLLFVAAALFWAARILLRIFEVLKMQNYASAALQSVVKLADISGEGYDEYIRDYAKCVSANRVVNNKKLEKIKMCYTFFLVIFATLLITTILLKDLCPIPG